LLQYFINSLVFIISVDTMLKSGNLLALTISLDFVQF